MAARLLRIGVRTIEWEKKHVKKFLMSILAITAIYCMSSLPAFSQKSTRQTQSSNAGNTDNSFLQKAIEANAAEVELGKMAESKSQNPRVKEFASMLVKDHTDALNRLQGVNSGSQSTQQTASEIPLSQQHQQLRDRLSKLSGDAFDRQYVNAMVTEHQKDIRQFEREVGSQTSGVREKPTEGSNQPVGTDEKSVTRELIPTMKRHLQQAQSLQSELSRGNSQR
jgi:putative membrane protein